MGETVGKLFINPSTLPGGENCRYVPDCGFVEGNTSVPELPDGAKVCRLLVNKTYALWSGAGASLSNSDMLKLLENNDYCEKSFFGFVQLLILLVVYGYILFWASNMISDGSELLMFVPSLKDLVGSVVLPILGAVPDGAIVLFSGLGPDAQKQLDVGVGALAGSTIMLLTVPWNLSLMAGRVDVINGQGNYRAKPSARLTQGHSCCGTGVTVKRIIKLNAVMMLVTAIPFLVIQFPAFIFLGQSQVNPAKYTHAEQLALAAKERPYAIVGLVLCVVVFILYLWFQAKYEDTDALFDRQIKRWLNGEIQLNAPLTALIADQLAGNANKHPA